MYSETDLYKRTRVDSVNITEVKVALSEIIKDFNHLVKMTQRYPVEITFAGNRYMFDSAEELAAIRACLEIKVSDYEVR